MPRQATSRTNQHQDQDLTFPHSSRSKKIIRTLYHHFYLERQPLFTLIFCCIMTEGGGKQRSLCAFGGGGSGATTALTTTAAAAAVATAAYYYYYSNHRSSPPRKSFHVEYGTFPPLPFALRIISKLPDQLRLKLLLKVLKPKLPQDGIDILGDDNEIQAAIAAATDDDKMINQQTIEAFRNIYSPYHINELVPNKLWKVTYEFLLDLNLSNSMKDLFGIDLTDQNEVVSQAPDHLKDLLRRDFQFVQAYKKLPTKLHQLMTYGANSCQNMFIIKLTENSVNSSSPNNDVLFLYNPCRMHPQMIDFLNNLGTVKFVVSGASSHTNQLSHVLETFPDAKLICASAAALKCQAAGMTKSADYLYDLSSSGDKSPYDDRLVPGQGTLEDAIEALKEFQDITLHCIKGEAATQPLVCVAHGVLLECDLLYVPLPSVWDDFISFNSILASWGRIFYYGAIKPSPTGHLPKYRYMMMDSSMVFASKCMLDVPLNENCLQMAQSLRTLLNDIPFQKASGAHSTYGKLSHCYERDEFRQAMNQTWNWLDGKSLLGEDEK